MFLYVQTKANRHGRKASAAAASSQNVDSDSAGQTVSANSGSLPTSVESCSARQKGLRHQRGKKPEAAAGSASAGASGGRQLAPFRGFSREYIEAHTKVAQETIRRKEIIIRLLKSGSLTDRQLKAIVPSSKTVSDCLVKTS